MANRQGCSQQRVCSIISYLIRLLFSSFLPFLLLNATHLQSSSPAIVNRENRPLSTAFLKKPPKRQYPDYYKIIQKPIALDDIKKRLDTRSYLTLEEVKADFELCFTNAKEYNMKDSEIWKDAKELMVCFSSCSWSKAN